MLPGGRGVNTREAIGRAWGSTSKIFIIRIVITTDEQEEKYNYGNKPDPKPYPLT